MSMAATAWAFSAPCETPLQRALLIWLSERVDEYGYFFSGTAASCAAAFCCASEADLEEAFASLLEMGLVQNTDGEHRLSTPRPERLPSSRPSNSWTPSKKLRQAMIDEAGGKCRACGSDDRLSLDHIVARSKGGPNHRSNLQVLCLRCNASKRDSDNWTGRRGVPGEGAIQ